MGTTLIGFGILMAIIFLLPILNNPAMASMWIKWKDPSKITMREALLTYFFLVLPLIILFFSAIYFSKR